MAGIAIKEVLIAVANELAKKAKDSMPKLREGEKIRREILKDGVYYRETVFGEQTFLAQYDLRRNYNE